MSKAKIQILITLVLSAAAAAAALFYISEKYKATVEAFPKFNHNQAPANSPPLSSENFQIVPMPDHLLLPVPFTSQAPFANWDQLHNEACEEASALMANAYFTGDSRTNILPDEANKEIMRLSKWEDQNFGYSLDINSKEAAEMINKVYGLNTRLVENFSGQDLKSELAQNHLVVISEYGRSLNNPNYKRPGPIHHMLLIKGYDGDSFITNDSGTRNGLNYIYDFNTIYNAAADWDHQASNVDLNKKIAIIVWK